MGHKDSFSWFRPVIVDFVDVSSLLTQNKSVQIGHPIWTIEYLYITVAGKNQIICANSMISIHSIIKVTKMTMDDQKVCVLKYGPVER